MAFRYPLLLIYLFCLQSAMALISGKYEKLFSIGFNVTKPEYSGDLGSTIFNFGQKSYMYYWGLGTTFSVNLNPSFDVGINGNFGSYGYNGFKAGKFFSSNKLDVSALVNYKLDNGYILNRENLFSPIITTGIGFAKYLNKPEKQDGKIEPGWDLILPVGAGVQIKFNKSWGFRYQYLYYITFNDGYDNKKVGGNDIFGQHLISIIFSFGNVVREVDWVSFSYP